MVCFKQTNFAEKHTRLSSQFFLEYVEPFDLLLYADETNLLCQPKEYVDFSMSFIHLE